MHWFTLHALTDRLMMLLAAQAISVIFFGIPGLRRAAGIVWAGKVSGQWVVAAEIKLNRQRRSAGTRVYRGILLLLFFLSLAGIIAAAIIFLRQFWSYGFVVETLLLAALLPARGLLDDVRGVSSALKSKKLPAAQKRAAALARRDHGDLDQHSLVRVSIEYLLENLSDKVIAPACWYLLLGFPGAIMARTVNLLDGAVGHKSRRFIAFGWASAWLDDCLQLIPARLTGLLLCLAAFFIPKGKPVAALRVLWRDARKTTSPNSGWPIAAGAGALGLTLAGPRRVAEGVVKDEWIGNGSVKSTRGDLIRAQWLYAVALLIWCLGLAGVMAVMV